MFKPGAIRWNLLLLLKKKIHAFVSWEWRVGEIEVRICGGEPLLLGGGLWSQQLVALLHHIELIRRPHRGATVCGGAAATLSVEEAAAGPILAETSSVKQAGFPPKPSTQVITPQADIADGAAPAVSGAAAAPRVRGEEQRVAAGGAGGQILVEKIGAFRAKRRRAVVKERELILKL